MLALVKSGLSLLLSSWPTKVDLSLVTASDGAVGRKQNNNHPMKYSKTASKSPANFKLLYVKKDPERNNLTGLKKKKKSSYY